jgi:phosphoribosylanthranilate isomerase
VKICGVTRVEDAELCVAAGADALGLNFIPGSLRRVDLMAAKRIAAWCRGRIEIVGVVADLAPDAAQELRDEIGLDALQLHGHEPPEVLVGLLPHAFKALRIGSASDLAEAAHFGGDRILIDAKVGDSLGGTGQRVELDLARSIAASRRVILAGGLRAPDVAEVIRVVMPWGVDVASGVEVPGRPGLKSESAVRAFVREARRFETI